MNIELEITWKRVARIWWSYLWRNLLAIVAAMFFGGIVGFFLGFALGIFGVPTKTIQMITAPIGAIIGLGISIIPLRMIIGKDFGDFRLILVASNPPKNSEIPGLEPKA